MIHISEILAPIFERLDRLETLISKSDTSDLMTIKDVVKYTSLSEPTIRRGIMRGRLKPIKEEGKKKEKMCGYTENIVLEGIQSFFE